MTFENEEGVNRAMEFNNTTKEDIELSHLSVWLDKYHIKIEKASEPSDIIWENRHFTEGQRLKKKLLVVALMVLMLMLSFSLIYACASYSLQLLKVYPDLVCEDLVDYDLEPKM